MSDKIVYESDNVNKKKGNRFLDFVIIVGFFVPPVLLIVSLATAGEFGGPWYIHLFLFLLAFLLNSSFSGKGKTNLKIIENENGFFYIQLKTNNTTKEMKLSPNFDYWYGFENIRTGHGPVVKSIHYSIILHQQNDVLKFWSSELLKKDLRLSSDWKQKDGMVWDEKGNYKIGNPVEFVDQLKKLNLNK